MLGRLLKDRDPAYLACAADFDWRPQWRVDLVASYKTHRLNLPYTPELDRQIPLAFELLSDAGVAVVGAAGYEAEDVIAALLPRCPGPVEIVSGDRDLFQLVRDPDVVVLYPKMGMRNLVTVDEGYIEATFGIPGRAYGDYAVLRGDASDGLPGVGGIGEKTAAALLSRYGSLEKVVQAALLEEAGGPVGKVRLAIDYVDRAARVVLLSPDIPLPDVDMTRPSGPLPQKVLDKAEALGLGNALGRVFSR